MLLDPPRVDSDGFAVPAQVCRPASEPDQGIGTPRIVVVGLLRSRKTLFVGGAHLGGLGWSPEGVAKQRNGLCADWEFPQVLVAIVSGASDRRGADDEDYCASHGFVASGGGGGRRSEMANCYRTHPWPAPKGSPCLPQQLQPVQILSMHANRFTPTAFLPARWLPGPHLQTLGARLLRPGGGIPLWRERVELPDGDFVDLDFAVDPESLARDGRRPLVLLLHGLEGSARSKYALETYRALERRGIAAVGLNFRSCSGELNRLPRMYHSGDTGDIAFVIRLLAERFPESRRGVIGFSLGGNALLKFLGESGESARAHLEAAAAVSVPYDLSVGADYLARPSGRCYSWFLLRKLQRKVRAKQHNMPPEVDIKRALAAKTFREFDDAATAPLHRFNGAEDYYQRSSSRRFIARIKIPTLLLQAADDPFQPTEGVPATAFRDNPNIVAVLTETGGHVGFVARSFPWDPVFWCEAEVARYMEAMLVDRK